jgi:protein-L-isoaspartate(D-aspartate) O-methyltransferase
MNDIDLEQARFNMIEQQIRPWEVLDQRVLDIIAKTPRENFVPSSYRNLAFTDVEIPLGHGQVMMSPKMEGRLLQVLSLQPSDSVLEVGTGSGYLTACLTRLSDRVLSVDIFPEFTESAQRKCKIHRIKNVVLRSGDAAQGWGNSRYDAIAITGSLPVLTENWRQQLNVGGRLFVVAGEPPIMEALLITRVGEQEWTQQSLFDTELPLLINAKNPQVFEF